MQGDLRHVDCVMARLWPSGQVLVYQFTGCIFVVHVAFSLYKLRFARGVALLAVNFGRLGFEIYIYIYWQGCAVGETAKPKFAMIAVSVFRMGREATTVVFLVTGSCSMLCMWICYVALLSTTTGCTRPRAWHMAILELGI